MRKIASKIAAAGAKAITEWRKYVLYPAIGGGIGAVIAALVLASLDGTSQTNFFSLVNANAQEVGGAGVFGGAHLSRDPINRIMVGHGQTFIGYCIGEPIASVSTGFADEIWFIRADHNVVPAAMMDGDPPLGMQPVECAGARQGPTSLTLKEGRRLGKLVLRAESQQARLIGFVIRTRESSDWIELPLVTARAGLAADETIPLQHFVAIAVACWAPGVPAHPRGPVEEDFVGEMRWPKGTSRKLLTTASHTVPEALRKACVPYSRGLLQPIQIKKPPATNRHSITAPRPQVHAQTDVPVPTPAPVVTPSRATSTPPPSKPAHRSRRLSVTHESIIESEGTSK